MIHKVLKRSIGTLALLGVLSLGFSPSLRAMGLGMGGSPIPATPFDHKQIGNHTIMANNSSLAGHVDIHDYAILGGFTLIHQFCKVGVPEPGTWALMFAGLAAVASLARRRRA